MESLFDALAAVLQPSTLVLLVVGAVWGILAGGIPGITPSLGMALLLPFTFGLSPEQAIVLLAASWSGSEYGGAIPAILINTPGAPANAATSLDGYPLAQKGEGGKAMGIGLVWGLFGQVISVIVCALLLFPLSRVLLAFGPPEILAAAVFGLTVVSSLGDKDVLKSILSVIFGLAVATVGFDPFSGLTRFSAGITELQDGLGLVPVLIGLFGVGELLHRAGSSLTRTQVRTGTKTVLPSWAELKALVPTGLISTAVGIVVGILPGAGSTASAYVAYNEARRWSKHPEEYGKGSYEGVVAAETANNAVIAGDLVPMLAFAVPGSTAAAVFMGGLLIHGIRPGPALFTQNADLLAVLFVALLLANPVVLAAGLSIIKPAVAVISLRPALVTTGILALIVTGAFADSNSTFDIGVVLLFGAVGVAMKRFAFSPAAALLGLVLGEIIESDWRRTATLARGNLTFILSRPIALALFTLAALALLYPLVMSAVRTRRRSRIPDDVNSKT